MVCHVAFRRSSVLSTNPIKIQNDKNSWENETFCVSIFVIELTLKHLIKIFLMIKCLLSKARINQIAWKHYESWFLKFMCRASSIPTVKINISKSVKINQNSNLLKFFTFDWLSRWKWFFSTTFFSIGDLYIRTNIPSSAYY